MLLLLTSAIAAGTAGALAVRGYAFERRVTALCQPVAHTPRRVGGCLRSRTTLPLEVVGATALDLAIALARIDPTILDAIDRVHGAQAFESFGALQEHILAVTERGQAAFDGLVSTYKGAAGELAVAEHLESLGHDVHLADFDQPDWDVDVDGAHFQIKAGLEDGPIADALDAHPEIPVLTVQEHVGDFAGEAVTALPISGEALTEATTETLDAVGDLGDLGFELPAFYVIGQIGREAEAIQAGRSTVGESAIRVAGRTAAVATGAKVGAAIGGLLLPWGGAWLGSIAGGLLARHWLADEPRPAPAPPPRKGRSKYEAGCAPEIDELARRLKAWVEAAAAAAEHEGHEARRQSRALARPASWRDRILPRRSVLIAEEGRRRLSAESAVFTDVADRLRSRSTLAWQGLLRTWSGGLPWLPGLAAEDEAVEAQLKRLRDLAKQHRQRDDRWQTQRGPRPAAVVEVPPPSFTTDWGRWAGVSVIAVVTAVATAFAAGGPTGLATELPAPTLSAVTAPRAPLTPPVVRVGDQGCRLRTAPSLKAPRLAALPPGSTCVVADRARPWIEVRCDERSGFLHEACLAPEQR